MRITNSMMRNNALWSINKNEELLNKYDTQVSTGKKIQRPSEDPIVAVRALKFRANLNEIAQFKTNAQDATSWLNVSEQAISNSVDMLKRARELCVQGASDLYETSDRESIVSELEQLKSQIMNEGNVSYAGRYIFSGYKTDTPLSFTEDTAVSYDITDHLSSDNVEKMQKAIGSQIKDVYRMRLPYSDVDETATPSTIAGFTVTAMNSTDTGAYEPPVDSVYLLKDTGELIFNSDNVNGVGAATAIPANFDYDFSKNSFEKGDINPINYFDCTNTSEVPPVSYTAPNDTMKYQISYNQDITVNTMGNKIFTPDLMRDFDEIIDAVKNVPDDGSDNQSLQEDLLGDFFDNMLGKLDNHIDNFVREETVIGSKTNRLELTINRLADDKVNFTDLMSNNEDVDMTEAVMNLQAQKVVYDASLSATSILLQKSLLDFIN